MTKTKKVKIHKHIGQEFVDYDYKKKLNKTEREFLDKFTKEYYGNEHNREGSLHRENLGNRYENEIKKQMWNMNNSRDRDVINKNKIYGRVASIEILAEPIDNKFSISDALDKDSSVYELLNKNNPNSVYKMLISKYSDILIKMDTITDFEDTLGDFSRDICTVFALHLKSERKIKTKKEKN